MARHKYRMKDEMGYYNLNLKSKRLKAHKNRILTDEVKQIDLTKERSIADLLEAYEDSSIQARNLGKAAQVFKNMLKDRQRPTILLGLAGPLIAAGLRKVIRDMIEYNLVDCIVSTGAIMYQDYYQALGGKHYKGQKNVDDALLRKLLINRIYDTYVDEEMFGDVDSRIGKFACGLTPKTYSSREFLELLSETINDNNSILVTARKRGVPIFCPALNDSSIGIGLTEHHYWKKKTENPGIVIDAIRDNYELTQIVVKSKATAAFYVAGGVPKNFINDSVVMSYIFKHMSPGHKYALQVTTATPLDGGLSGSTLKEATSWGKIKKTASRAMAFIEPSVSLPLLVGYALQRKLANKRKRLKYLWNEDILERLSYR